MIPLLKQMVVLTINIGMELLVKLATLIALLVLEVSILTAFLALLEDT